ncbi:MAG: DUF6599 family protein [bacterium]
MRLYVSIMIILMSLIYNGCFNNDDPNETATEDIDLLSITDVNIQGWTLERSRFIVDRQEMKRYFGKSEELYFAYGFEKLLIREYKNQKSLPIKIEAYLVNSSEDAYGLFTFDQIGKKLNIGQGAVYSLGILRFWKDRLFIKVIATEEYQELEKTAIMFARIIDSKIKSSGIKPRIINYIPEEKLIFDSIHYFHKNISFNNIYYLPETVHLGLNEDTNGVSAQYSFGGGNFPRLIIIEYPDDISAKTAFENFRRAYFTDQEVINESENNIIIRTDENDYNSMVLYNKIIILTFESLTVNTCKKLSDQTILKIEQNPMANDK